MDLSVFSEMESEVRSYVRSFPTVFETARGSIVTDEDVIKDQPPPSDARHPARVDRCARDGGSDGQGASRCR